MDDRDKHENPFASPLAEEAPVAVTADVSDAEALRREYLSREASIRSVGWIYYLFAVGFTLAGLAMFFFVNLPSGGPGARPAGFDTVFWGLVGFYGVLAILCWWIAPGLRSLRPSVRYWVIGLNGLLLFFSLIGLNPIGLAINGYILWLMLGEKAALVFSPEYKEIIAATPHIKYKTSIIMWIVLAVLLAVLALLVGFAMTR